jgi:hypothetical protein
MGLAWGHSVLFDRFEAGSTPEQLATVGVALVLPTCVSNGGSINAKTCRKLAQQLRAGH